MYICCCANVGNGGAKIIFADIDPSTELMDLDDCLKKLQKIQK